MKNDKLTDEVFKKAISVWGEDAQIDQVIEEMGEVLVAYNHLKRKRVSKDALIEEFVDVYIMMKQMRFLNEAIFDQIYEYKVNRLRHRLEMYEPYTPGSNGDVEWVKINKDGFVEKEADDAVHRTERQS